MKLLLNINLKYIFTVYEAIFYGLITLLYKKIQLLFRQRKKFLKNVVVVQEKTGLFKGKIISLKVYFMKIRILLKKTTLRNF